MWGIWSTIFIDERAEVAKYSHRVFVVDRGSELQRPSIGFRAQGNLIHLGTSENLQLGQIQSPAETFLQLRCPRYRDIDVKVKLQILTSANGNPTHWFGIACRALRPDHWDAYLFYVRQNGDVEFGMKGQLDVKPQLIPEVASQPVTVRMRVESNSVQTWVNDRPCHYWVDTDREFVRKGDIYLIAYATEVGIHSVEITVKKWYGPLIQFGKRFWKSFVVAGIIVGFIAALLQILG